MPSSSRITDLGVGICVCGDPFLMGPGVGALTTGSGDVIDNSHGVSRVSDIIVGYCSGGVQVGVMASGSGTVYANGLQQCRIGDPFVGCFIGVLTTGEGTVLVGG